jgi:hypothetical protein
MRLLIALLLFGCSKAGNEAPNKAAPPPAQHAPAPARPAGPPPAETPDDAGDDNEGPCPKTGGPQTTGVRRIGLYGRMLPDERGHAWYSKKNFTVFDREGKVLEKVDIAEVPANLVAQNADAWFVQSCEAGGCGEHGTGHELSRLDRATKKTTKLAGPESEIAFAEVIGDDLYWATFGPYGQTGELRRVPIKGGKTETLWKGTGVNRVLIQDGTAYVAEDKAVWAVALDGRKPRQLAKDLTQAEGLAANATHVYITDRGDPYGKSAPSGSVLRVAVGGGAVEKLAGPVRWPNVVAVDDARIYFMGDESGDVMSMPITGGAPSVLIPTPPKDWPCRSTVWMMVNKIGLQYVRMSKGWDSSTGKVIDWGTLWSIRREFMDDPVKQFADWVATHGSGAGSSSGSQADP